MLFQEETPEDIELNVFDFFEFIPDYILYSYMSLEDKIEYLITNYKELSNPVMYDIAHHIATHLEHIESPGDFFMTQIIKKTELKSQ